MAAVALHLRRWGSPGEPPPVLLVHATGDTSADWDEVASGLAHDRLVVAVDLRGHGESPRPGSYALTELADDLVVVAASLAAEHGRPADVVAHSLGGLVACLLLQLLLCLTMWNTFYSLLWGFSGGLCHDLFNDERVRQVDRLVRSYEGEGDLDRILARRAPNLVAGG